MLKSRTGETHPVPSLEVGTHKGYRSVVLVQIQPDSFTGIATPAAGVVVAGGRGEMNKSQQANLIKLLAVVTAAPRWTGALLASEGFAIPDAWRGWWIIASAILSLAMAGVEGWAFAFIFSAWRNQRDEGANRLLVLAILAASIFIIVLTPFIVAQVRGSALEAVLAGQPWAAWVWGAAVASSTIVIVGSVGYAHKDADGVSMADYRHLQTVAMERAQELDTLEAELAEATRGASERDELLAWVETLRNFDASTKQGAAAMISFALNGDHPTQRELAAALDASEGTIRLGQARAREAQ